MVEYPDRGPVVLQSYLEPPGTEAQATKTAEDEDESTGGSKPQGDEPAPTLIGVVVAGSADEAREARRAAGRLERVGREFQKEWASDITAAADRDSSLATTD